MEYLPVFIILMCALFNYNGGASVTRIKRSGFDWAIDDYGCRIPGSGSGDCISINKCKAFQSFIPDRDDYICGYDGNQVKVCCPPELPSSIGPKSALDHSQHRNIGLLPTRDVCGKSEPIVRIVNGNLTDLSEYPWAAALKFNKSDYPYSCGATLISKRYVLTAAHCIRNPFTLLSVRLGEYNFSSAVDCVGFGKQKICANEPQDFQVSADDAIVHPEHVPKKYINDIALIRLPRDAVLDQSVIPICLPVQEIERKKTYENYTVIGWGKTETDFSSKVLLKALVPTVDNSICASRYLRQAPVSDNQLCAGGKNGQDACTGDSGSSLSNDFVDEDYTIRAIQYGLVSFGPKACGRESYPVVYTKIANYVEWILDNIKP